MTEVTSQRRQLIIDNSGGMPHNTGGNLPPPVAHNNPGRRPSELRRLSVAGSIRTDFSHLNKQHQKAENTYRLGPEEKFNPTPIEKWLHEMLKSVLENGASYNPVRSAGLAKSLTEKMKLRMKDLNYPRYKFVCFVSIAQNSNQGFHSSSRCIWNPATDCSASAKFSKGNISASATIFGTYFE